MMKKMLLVWGIAAAVAGVPVIAMESQAASDAVTPEMKALIAQPMQMDHTANTKRHVTLSHTAHQQIDCVFCHHKPVDGNAFVSCTVSGCHDNFDRKDKSEHSYYQAIHRRNSEKSCRGCHKKMSQTSEALKEKFRGCSPCHPRGKN